MRVDFLELDMLVIVMRLFSGKEIEMFWRLFFWVLMILSD